MPDVRMGGTWSPRQRLKNDALWLAASLALAGARRLPVPALRGAAKLLGVLAYFVASGPRGIALANVARVFPGWSSRDRAALVRRSFVAIFGWLGESARSLAGDPRRPAALRVDPDALALLHTARGKGRGVLFASAHLGPWEHVAASLAAVGVPLITMARESYDPRFSRLFQRMRENAGVRVIWRGQRAAPWRIARALRRGDVLGMPMDLRTRVPSRLVPFLGHPAPTAIGPARIALRVGAPVVVGTVAPTPNGPPQVTATAIPTDDLDDDDAGALELSARINAELSRRILAFPDAWVWMHRRWTGDGEV